MTPARLAAALSVAMFVATVAAGWAASGQPLSLSALHFTPAPSSPSRPLSELRLPDRVVPVATLRRGQANYQRHCAGCHGDAGDGDGPSGRHLSPPPRDFRRAAFKFAAVPSGSLPRDEDLARTIRRGLTGTAMLGWSFDDRELDALVQYLKTFSPRWQRELPPAAAEVAATTDPWRDHHAEAVREGERVYHREALCATCHPAYVASLNPTRPDPTRPVALYEPAHATWVLAPDFRRHPMRAGARVDDLHRAIAFGLGGTPMPTWQGALPDRSLWALAHYVRSLTPRE